ncbi:hypothetical protein COV53_06415 [Candidatus Gottesmanbacteria bacterium CG11_big_fil_rev_8_21_14_0_20_37_11]|uniref:Divalent-cation tolerance protein CutA n=3 Tax=Candidatus Gottesmaniibacteriota TaxID=1752720 RepID=A0A2M7RRM2_9BACT|nr:MAG: hypothetical protein AUJ73_00205 [Candidatus Gottesmanbacteria bacterium CG1_02_37_22]PIP33147.1 MAG: hypothetical protein COX23_00890 [Candidatus Gottesmanbacteria bacterium CG23_combo_of_CG06-09_8_20_14_all_37_19]PIR07800.1 MAG: hypothetical protein COV53_06415 [Candidatus Gottesmanbacteria bacterium CG11_big_fil_rev_8_21_14_0_20_37_11]PIZ02860.1 MAG: hypothetical protein COY59_02505 [Candidatus Gottesmanbacteria bacterium CG_4_10_14_0_8_um_filter_37_24]
MNIIVVPCKDLKEAKKIARFLTSHKLAVCTNIIPSIISIYRWKGRVEEGREVLLLVKTVKSKLDAAITRIKELHSYGTPDLIHWETSKDVNWLSSWIKDELGK